VTKLRRLTALALLSLTWLSQADADCLKDHRGEVICGAGACSRDQRGDVYCAQLRLGSRSERETAGSCVAGVSAR